MDIIIFGISGNLAERKLIPALIDLYGRGRLPKNTRLIGFSRSPKLFDQLPFEYQHIVGAYDDPASFKTLEQALRLDVKHLAYLALPPTASKQVLRMMHHLKVFTLIEKPFGEGFKDAQGLARFLETSAIDTCHVKVDHYAGKKELRALQKEDPAHIQSLTIEILETATVDHRAGFYDAVGALRDVGQNHLLFMLARIFHATHSRSYILSRLVPAQDHDAHHFARYDGREGKETYFSVKAHIDDPELRHIDITLRSGKALAENRVAIIVTYTSGETKEIVLEGGHEAYMNILEDAIEGRLEGFLSTEEVLAAWKFIEEVERIKEKKEILCYPIGYDQRFFNEKAA